MKGLGCTIRLVICVFTLSACETFTSTQQSTVSIPNTDKLFVGGTKAVKVNLSDATVGGSFAVPMVTPTPVAIPYGYPGYDGASLYVPGVSANRYYDVDGVTATQKPSWIQDIQLGITGVNTSSSTCATFGAGGTGTYDPTSNYRVSEADCGSTTTGTGGSSDPVFIRIILNRDTAYLGTRENLLLQLEYQATGIRLNSVASSGSTNDSPESNLDQLWKVFWNSSLKLTSAATPFSIFVPPNYASQDVPGTGVCAAGYPNCIGSPTGSSVTVKQILVPISANTSQSVIQISRVSGRVNLTSGASSGAAYVKSYCGPSAGGSAANSSLCLGIVFRSLMVMRI